jgi:hypothetical protein
MQRMQMMAIFFLVLSGCATKQPKQSAPAQKESTKIVLEKPHIDTQSIMIHPGHVKKIDFRWPTDWGKVELECKNNPVHLARDNDHVFGFLAETYHSKIKPFTCTAKGAGKEYFAFDVKVEKFPFKYETLNVDKKRVNLNAQDLKRWRKEVAELKKVYSSLKIKEILFDTPFVSPLASKITSLYGKARLFNNNKKSWHNGIDFRAATGTPITVANKGEVVFTGDLFFNGNTVIVDHGLGIISLYCHLSKIGVKKGDIVEQGELVGLAGATGRVTGPHLHWGVRINGDWINGLSLVEESQR